MFNQNVLHVDYWLLMNNLKPKELYILCTNNAEYQLSNFK